ATPAALGQEPGSAHASNPELPYPAKTEPAGCTRLQPGLVARPVPHRPAARRRVAERRHVPGWAARQLPRGLDGSGGSGPHWNLRTVERLVPGLDPLSGGVVVAVDAPPVSPRAEPCRHGGVGRGQDASGG